MSVFVLIPLEGINFGAISVFAIVAAVFFLVTFLAGIAAAGRFPRAYVFFSAPVYFYLAAVLPLPSLFITMVNFERFGEFTGMFLMLYVLMLFFQYMRLRSFRKQSGKTLEVIDRSWLLSDLESRSIDGAFWRKSLRAASGIAEYLIVVAVVFLPIVVLLQFSSDMNSSRARGMEILGLYLGGMLALLAAQLKPSARQVTRNRKKGFYLYLRSFDRSFDRIEKVFSRRSHLNFGKLSAGELLSRVLLHPIISARNVALRRKEIGTWEDSYSNQEWRREISRDIRKCLAGFVCLSRTSGLREELSLIKAAGRTTDCLYIFSTELSCRENLEILERSQILDNRMLTLDFEKATGVFYSKASGWVLVLGNPGKINDTDLVLLCAAFSKRSSPEFGSFSRKYGHVA